MFAFDGPSEIGSVRRDCGPRALAKAARLTKLRGNSKSQAVALTLPQQI